MRDVVAAGFIDDQVNRGIPDLRVLQVEPSMKKLPHVEIHMNLLHLDQRRQIGRLPRANRNVTQCRRQFEKIVVYLAEIDITPCRASIRIDCASA